MTLLIRRYRMTDSLTPGLPNSDDGGALPWRRVVAAARSARRYRNRDTARRAARRARAACRERRVLDRQLTALELEIDQALAQVRAANLTADPAPFEEEDVR